MAAPMVLYMWVQLLLHPAVWQVQFQKDRYSEYLPFLNCICHMAGCKACWDDNRGRSIGGIVGVQRSGRGV